MKINEVYILVQNLASDLLVYVEHTLTDVWAESWFMTYVVTVIGTQANSKALWPEHAELTAEMQEACVAGADWVCGGGRAWRRCGQKGGVGSGRAL